MRTLILAGALALGSVAAPSAQTVIVGIDEKVNWDAAGKPVYTAPDKDVFAVLDLAVPGQPKLTGSLPLMNSIFGPPTNLAVHPSGKFALIANSMEWQKDGDAWKPVPDNKVHLVDLGAGPPKVVATVETGKQPSGLDINAKGDLALVTNRADNSISVLALDGASAKVVATVPMGDSVAHVRFTPDGKRALAIKPVVNKVAVLQVDGATVTYAKQDIVVGIFPYNIDVTPNGQLALVVNNGAGGGSDGSVDTVSIIDLEATPPRVVDHVVVGDAPEGLAISPRGDLAVAILLRGSNADQKAFYYNKTGSVVALKIDGKKVTKVGEVEVGGLPEGVVFSKDGGHLYVGNYLDRDVTVLKVDGTSLADTGTRVKLPGQPASMRAGGVN